MRFLLGRRAWRRLRANRVSGHGVCRSRVGVIRVALDEGVIDERSRALKVVSFGRIGGDRLASERTQQIADLRITDIGFRYINCYCPIRRVGSLGGGIDRCFSEQEYRRNSSIGERA